MVLTPSSMTRIIIGPIILAASLTLLASAETTEIKDTMTSTEERMIPSSIR